MKNFPPSDSRPNPPKAFKLCLPALARYFPLPDSDRLKGIGSYLSIFWKTKIS